MALASAQFTLELSRGAMLWYQNRVIHLAGGVMFRLVFALCAGFSLVSAHAQAPRILQQPQSRTAAVGSSTVFDVTIDPGVPDVRYQWRLNGGNLDGEIGSSLTLSNVQVASAGLYTVVAFTESEAVTSNPAELQLADVPLVPFSDLLDDGPSIIGATGQVQGFNIGATPEPGEPAHGGRPARRSVWATWVSPDIGGIVTFRTAGSGFDTVLAVYTGSSIPDLVEARSDDDAGGFLTSEVSFHAQPQTPYHIVVDGFGGASGRFMLAWNVELTPDRLPTFAVEPNDQTVGPGSDVEFIVAPLGNYTWQWFFNGQLLTNETSSTLLVRNASADNVGTYVCRAADGGRTGATRARLEINYNDLGIVDSSAITTEKFFDTRLRTAQSQIKTTGPRPKTVAHGFSGTQIFSTLGSTKEPGEPNHCGVAGGASEWFAFQADTNGTIYISTDGSNFDTVLAVYTGPGDDFSTLVSVACDNNSGLDGKDSRVAFAGTAGTIYWIAVDGANNAGTGQPARGSVTLHYRVVMPLQFSAVAYTNASGGRMTFKISGTPNLAAAIQAASLDSTNWVSLITNSSSTGTFNYTNTGINAGPGKFYRAVNRF
ncbi:MAG TPA: immunoglobulin domain-containing protein [Methylomirabilota bacterium]|nr:immunoglobulin domain-containing protein [Methylomirabilota bacterium]